jgi:hypothetical protein
VVDLADVVRAIEDPDGVDAAIRLQEEYVAEGDTSRVVEVKAQLGRFLEAGNDFGRDLMCEALAELDGAAALEPLLRAAAYDLGDDQDMLTSLLVMLIVAHREQARQVVSGMLAEPDARTREVAEWATEFVEHYW